MPKIKTCALCGKIFQTNFLQRKFCSDDCIKKMKRRHNENRRHALSKPKQIKPKMINSFDERIKQADACGLSYGNYVAQLRLGKTFEELKAAYESRLHDDF